MTTLIIGGSGYIGLHTIKKFVDEGEDVVVYDIAMPQLDKVRAFYGLNLDKVKFVKGDVTNFIKLMETCVKYNVDHIVYLAAYLTVASEENPYQAFKVNVEGVVNTLEIARITDVKKFVFTSSEAVYGITEENVPVDEDHPKKPISMYGVLKLSSELIALKYSDIYGLNVAILRFPMVYGAGLAVGGTRPINVMVEDAVRHKLVKVNFKEDSKVEPLHVVDAAHSIYLAVKVKNLRSRVYNIGVGKMYTLREIFNVIKEFVPDAQAVFGSDDMTFIYPVQGPLKIERAREELGYNPQYDLKKGIENYVFLIKKGLFG